MSQVFDGPDLVPLLAGRNRGYAEYECRRCGRSLRRERGTCPSCGNSDIVHIEI